MFMGGQRYDTVWPVQTLWDNNVYLCFASQISMRVKNDHKFKACTHDWIITCKAQERNVLQYTSSSLNVFVRLLRFSWRQLSTSPNNPAHQIRQGSLTITNRKHAQQFTDRYAWLTWCLWKSRVFLGTDALHSTVPRRKQRWKLTVIPVTSVRYRQKFLSRWWFLFGWPRG